MYAYINLNPVLDKIVEKPEDYNWSSYKELLYRKGGICDKDFIIEKFRDPADFEKFIKNALPVLKINKKLRRFKLE